MTPLALLPVYLTLVAISRRNCESIPFNQQVVVDASAQLSESITKFREFLEPFATILPTNDQMKDIPSPFNPFTNWEFPSSPPNTTSHSDLKTMENDFLGMIHAFGRDAQRWKQG